MSLGCPWMTWWCGSKSRDRVGNSNTIKVLVLFLCLVVSHILLYVLYVWCSARCTPTIPYCISVCCQLFVAAASRLGRRPKRRKETVQDGGAQQMMTSSTSGGTAAMLVPQLLASTTATLQLQATICCIVLPPPPTSALWNDRRCMSVRPSVRRVIRSNSRTQRTRKPKIAAMEANQTSNPWTYLEVKRSMVKVTRPSSIGNNNDSSIRSSNSYTGATIALPTGSDVEGASRRTSVHTNPYEENTVRNIFRRKWKAFYGSY